MFLSRFLRFFSVLCYSQCWFFCLLIVFSCKLNCKLHFTRNFLANMANFFLPEEHFTSYTFTFFTAVIQWFPSTIGQYKGNNDQLKKEPIENDKYFTHFQYKLHVLNLSSQQQRELQAVDSDFCFFPSLLMCKNRCDLTTWWQSWWRERRWFQLVPFIGLALKCWLNCTTWNIYARVSQTDGIQRSVSNRPASDK